MNRLAVITISLMVFSVLLGLIFIISNQTLSQEPGDVAVHTPENPKSSGDSPGDPFNPLDDFSPQGGPTYPR